MNRNKARHPQASGTGETRIAVMVLACVLLGASQVVAQQQSSCRVLCKPQFGVEPTMTLTNPFGRVRIVQPDGTTARERRDAEFELVFSLELPTRVSWLGFTLEGSFGPFDPESTPELELETNLAWLPSERTAGWIESTVDVVDDFSPAERPTDRRAYTHKLNFELDSSVAIFNRLPEGRWLKGVELQATLDYIASGLARKGDIVDGVRFIDNSSPWSFSFVVALPVAPF